MRRNIVAITVIALALVSVVIFTVVQNSAECSGPASVPSTDSPNATFEAADDGFILRITGDEQFHTGALGWFLRIGDVEFSWGLFPGTTLDTIAFDVPSEALEHLADGDSITVNYGNPPAPPFEIDPDPPGLPTDPIANYIAATCGRTA